MLKVLQIIPTLDRSGAEKQMALLAAGLPRDRFAVEVAVLTRFGPLAADLRAAGVPIHDVRKRGKLDPRAVGRLTRILRDGRFDVAHTWIFAADVYGRLAARRAKTPAVVTSEMAVDLWKGRAHLAIDRSLARWTGRVVGNSRAVVEFYRRVGIPDAKLEMIYSGIEPGPPPTADPTSTRRALGVVETSPLFLFAGRLMAQKAVGDLLMALDVLQHVEPAAVTLIAGDGPLRAGLERTAAGYDLLDTGRVRFLGHRSDVPDLIAASDAVVLPSRYEGLPNILLEAMRAGKPVAATAAPGTTELVVANETGLLTPVAAPTGLARSLRSLARDPALCARLGGAGRARVESEFGLDVMIARFADLYERLSARDD